MLTKPGDLPPFSVPKLTKQLSLSQGCQKMLSAPFRAKNIVLHIGFFFFSSRIPKFGQKITLFLSVSSCFSVSVLGAGRGPYWTCYISRSETPALRQTTAWLSRWVRKARGLQMRWLRCRPTVCSGRGLVFPRLQSGLPNTWLPPYLPACGGTRVIGGTSAARSFQPSASLHLPRG